MSEEEVMDCFTNWLIGTDWIVERGNAQGSYLIAQRTNEIIIAEAIGITTDPGKEVDTGNGRLVRRVLSEVNPQATYALVVPEEIRKTAQRVNKVVRERLGSVLYIVDSKRDVYESLD